MRAPVGLVQCASSSRPELLLIGRLCFRRESEGRNPSTVVSMIRIVTVTDRRMLKQNMRVFDACDRAVRKHVAEQAAVLAQQWAKARAAGGGGRAALNKQCASLHTPLRLFVLVSSLPRALLHLESPPPPPPIPRWGLIARVNGTARRSTEGRQLYPSTPVEDKLEQTDLVYWREEVRAGMCTTLNGHAHGKKRAVVASPSPSSLPPSDPRALPSPSHSCCKQGAHAPLQLLHHLNRQYTSALTRPHARPRPRNHRASHCRESSWRPSPFYLILSFILAYTGHSRNVTLTKTQDVAA